MKLDKKKVVFGSVLICILAFIVCYYLMMFPGDREPEDGILSEPQVPGVQEPANTYHSRIRAVDELEERKPSTAPSLYQEIGVDSIPENFTEEELLTDQSNDSLTWNMQSWSFTTETVEDSLQQGSEENVQSQLKNDSDNENQISPDELALRQELFFSVPHSKTISNDSDLIIRVFIDGQQTIRVNSRVRMRLDTGSLIGGKWYPRLTPVYGFVRFTPNRVQLSVEKVQMQPVELRAFDLQDGSIGIYTENNFRADLSRELLDDALDEVNIPSLPQVSGLSRLFQKNNRQVKVSIPDQYQLLLKPGS